MNEGIMLMKVLTAVFGMSVTGIAVCLGMTIYLGVKEVQEKKAPAPITIPVPAQ